MSRMFLTEECGNELDVYDQCCGNCRNTRCPALYVPEDDSIDAEKAEQQFLEEDCVEKDGSIVWCIHWKGHESVRNYNDTDE